MTKEFSFTCKQCGSTHTGSPSFSYKKPVNRYLPDDFDQLDQAFLTSDLCIVPSTDGDPESESDYWIKANLEIPIKDANYPFLWGVWVTQSKDSFKRYAASFEDDQTGDRSFGWLPVTMPYWGDFERDDFVHLGCDVEWGPVGIRPTLWLHECAHQLFVDQRDGISWQKAVEIAQMVMHPKD